MFGIIVIIVTYLCELYCICHILQAKRLPYTRYKQSCLHDYNNRTISRIFSSRTHSVIMNCNVIQRSFVWKQCLKLLLY